MRLAMAGYPRYHLVLAKLSALTLVCAAIAGYATVAVGFSWPPRQPLLLAAALFCAALTYGALGVVFGSVLRREVEGMFAILMISILDVALQNPLSSSGSDSAVVRFLPTYGAVQAGMSAAFSDASAVQGLVIQCLWLIAAASAGFLVFHAADRKRAPAGKAAMDPGPPRAGSGRGHPRAPAPGGARTVGGARTAHLNTGPTAGLLMPLSHGRPTPLCATVRSAEGSRDLRDAVIVQ